VTPIAPRVLLASALAALSLMAVPAPAGAMPDGPSPACFDPEANGAAAAKGGNPRAADHREISAEEQQRIEERTARILAAKGNGKGKPGGGGGGGGGTGPGGPKSNVPVYVHVMAAADGTGNVTDQQISDQIAVLNASFGSNATGIGFTLAGIDRFYNDQWHKDRRSTTYRAQTRQGGKNALNMWLVDFAYLGIATFPWDYASNPSIDGIRVNFDSLPGGGIANYNLGETATHEAGHWFGLYHTFQGGCTATNDSVADTPAQSSATSGCPEGRDSCSLPGLDPIHNYMDYSYDDCYSDFSGGQSTRMDDMWTAYRL
jgi:hypothetical protein